MEGQNSFFAKTSRRNRVRSIRECGPPRTRGTSCSDSYRQAPRTRLAAAYLAQHDRPVRLIAYQLRQGREQLAAVAGVDPVRSIPAEMVPSRPCCDPDLTRCRVAIDDNAAAVGKIQLQYAGVPRLAVAIGPAFLHRPRNPLQHRIGQAVEFARGHRRAKLVCTNQLSASPCAASLPSLSFSSPSRPAATKRRSIFPRRNEIRSRIANPLRASEFFFVPGRHAERGARASR